eukprot:6508686-Lingulodinium_polyedra.AAC.1
MCKSGRRVETRRWYFRNTTWPGTIGRPTLLGGVRPAEAPQGLVVEVAQRREDDLLGDVLAPMACNR